MNTDEKTLKLKLEKGTNDLFWRIQGSTATRCGFEFDIRCKNQRS